MDAAHSPRPRRAVEDPDEFYASFDGTEPLHASRILRAGFAASAVGAVAALSFLAPGLAQATAGSASQSGDDNLVSAEVFASRSGSTDRSARRAMSSPESLADAVGARSAALSAQGEQVVTQRQQTAVANRAAGLDSASTQIRAESERLLSLAFFKPTDGEITSEWGMRRHPILRYTRMHAGVDMGGACGQPIWAARDGVVTDVSSGAQSGNQVRIDHGSDSGQRVETAYLHMERIDVKVGDEVKRGQVIGTVGNTGLSTSCHLHFATYANGDNVNPRIFLDA